MNPLTGEPTLTVGRHHDIREVGGGQRDEHAPRGLRQRGEVGAALVRALEDERRRPSEDKKEGGEDRADRGKCL